MLDGVHVIREDREVDEYLRREYKVYDEYEINIIGYAVVLVEEDCAHIGVINVDRNYRGHGIGTAILLSILKDFSDKKIEVETFSHIVPWYRKHGFKLLSESGSIFRLVHLPNL